MVWTWSVRYCSTKFQVMPPKQEPKKRCWCRQTCGKVLCRTTRRQHYRSAVNAGEEDGIQPSEDENMIMDIDVANLEGSVDYSVLEMNSNLGSMSNSDSEINSDLHNESNDSDWEWREMDEASQSDDDLMGDQELLEELEESIVNRQQELFSMRKS